MARIQKGFALAVAVVGFFSLLFGVGLAIASWVLTSRFEGVVISDNDDQTLNSGSRHFTSFWWGGLFYCIPGLLGIIAGCSKNIVVMIFYLIFNILCLISSVVVSALVAVVIVFWSVINTMLINGDCNDNTMYPYIYNKYCKCSNGYDTPTYYIYNAKCSDVKSASSVLGAIMAMAVISSFLGFIAAYVSCCSLCHQETDHGGQVIIQPGAGTYQPPPTMFVPAQTPQQHYAPPPYVAQPYTVSPYAPQTHDNAALVISEY